MRGHTVQHPFDIGYNSHVVVQAVVAVELADLASGHHVAGKKGDKGECRACNLHIRPVFVNLCVECRYIELGLVG